MFTIKKQVQKYYKIIVLAENNDVMIERDYDESLEAEFDMEIQSEAFGFNHTLFI